MLPSHIKKYKESYSKLMPHAGKNFKALMEELSLSLKQQMSINQQEVEILMQE